MDGNDSPDSSDGTVGGALEEMEYTRAESQFHDEGFATSIPAQLRFTDDVTQETDRFHDALEKNGYSPLDTDPDRSISGRRGAGEVPYYDGEICSNDHYNRISIWVGRSDVVRIYPLDEYVPTADELSQIISAIEIGFDSELEHDPIDDDPSADNTGDTDV